MNLLYLSIEFSPVNLSFRNVQKQNQYGDFKAKIVEILLTVNCSFTTVLS